MKIHLKRITIRGIVTVIAALCIFLGSFFNYEDFLSILFGCILGGIYGAGAAGIYLVIKTAKFLLFSSNLEYLTLFSGSFLAALVSGLILGSPMPFEKKLGVAQIFKDLIAILASYIILCLFFFFAKGKENLIINLPSLFLKAAATLPLTIILRPIAGTQLYGSNEEEADELLESLRKKDN